MSKLPEKFWRQVDKQESGCWVWTGYREKGGYGRFYAPGALRSKGAHRLAYEDANGAITEGFHIDHLCRNPSCVNPDHLEAVTPIVNVRRGLLGPKPGECRWGHVMDEENTYFDGRGMRRCRKCNVMNVLRNRAKKGAILLCAFCGEPVYSLAAYKTHLERDCEIYPQTDAAPWMPHHDEVSTAHPKPEQSAT